MIRTVRSRQWRTPITLSGAVSRAAQHVAQLQASVPGLQTTKFQYGRQRALQPQVLRMELRGATGLHQQVHALAELRRQSRISGAQSNAVWKCIFSARDSRLCPLLAPDPRFGEIRELNNQGWSNYNGFVSSFRWRMSSNFTGNFSYTWSHALDTCSNDCLEPFNAAQCTSSLRYQISPVSLRALTTATPITTFVTL